jgi:hypothetical protein
LAALIHDKYLTLRLLALFRDNPILFMRCNRDGTENPLGKYWGARNEPASPKATDPETRFD